jgi:hypothetical protein
MTMHCQGRVLYVIVCSAGPAGQGRPPRPAGARPGLACPDQRDPPALSFIDVPKLEAQTGRPVRSGGQVGCSVVGVHITRSWGPPEHRSVASGGCRVGVVLEVAVCDQTSLTPILKVMMR